MEARGTTGSRQELRLIGGVHVMIDGRRAEIPEGSRRLLVYVAFHGRRADRRQVAGALWPVGGDARAAGNLRSALWRLRSAGLRLLDGDRGVLTLPDHVAVDTEEISAWASRLVRGCPEPRDLAIRQDWLGALDLLPGWYDDWVGAERARIRQRMLHALEALSQELRARGRYPEAVDVALEAVSAEPLRESAHRALADAHAAQGNQIEARRCIARYRDLLDRELGAPHRRARTRYADAT